MTRHPLIRPFSPRLPSLTGTTTLLLAGLLLMGIILPSLLAGYETPDYTVRMQEGSYEIRDYPSLTLVSTPMTRRGQDGSFMKLFRFIRGRNEDSQAIAMTTPVIMTGGSNETMSFIMPKDVVRKGVPLPSNPDLSLTVRPPARYAAYRFRGSTSLQAGLAAAEKLRTWVSDRHFTTAGDPVFAYYNPPWTPGFLRRNEVLIPCSIPLDPTEAGKVQDHGK